VFFVLLRGGMVFTYRFDNLESPAKFAQTVKTFKDNHAEAL
jgi:hypothetical protein